MGIAYTWCTWYSSVHSTYTLWLVGNSLHMLAPRFGAIWWLIMNYHSHSVATIMVGYPIHSDPWWSKKNTSSVVPHTLSSNMVCWKTHHLLWLVSQSCCWRAHISKRWSIASIQQPWLRAFNSHAWFMKSQIGWFQSHFVLVQSQFLLVGPHFGCLNPITNILLGWAKIGYPTKNMLNHHIPD